MKKAVTIMMLAIMALGAVSFVPSLTMAETSVQGTWGRMNGWINQWNTTDGNSTMAFGWVVANAAIFNINGTTHEWAKAYAMWSDLVRPTPIPDARPLGPENEINDTIAPGNFSRTFSFYTAMLLNFTDISFNKTESGHDFLIAGFWNVTQRTETINITLITSGNDTWGGFDRNINVTWKDTPIAINASGILAADWGGTMGWLGKFTLSIDGVGILSGFASRGIEWTHPLNICDLGGAQGVPRGTVDINDLAKVAKHFGEAPGFGSFDPNLDVNGNGKIDIGDLTTVAANIQG